MIRSNTYQHLAPNVIVLGSVIYILVSVYHCQNYVNMYNVITKIGVVVLNGYTEALTLVF